MSRTAAPVDLADPALYAAGIPHEVFDEIRATDGLVWNAIDGDPDDGYWVVARHADIGVQPDRCRERQDFTAQVRYTAAVDACGEKSIQ